MVTTTTYDQKPITPGEYNKGEEYNDNVAAANRTAAALKATIDEVATEAVRKVNGQEPDADGALTLPTGGAADSLTQAQIDALPSAQRTPGRLLLNSDTDALEVVGSDGIVRAETLLLFGDGSDGDVTISGTVTLSRNMYYRNLTVPNGATLIANGYRIHVAELLLVAGGGTVRGSALGAAGTSIPALIALAGVGGGSGGAGGTGGSVSSGAGAALPPTSGAAGGATASGSTIRQLLHLLAAGVTAGGNGGIGGVGGGYDPGSGGTRNSQGGNTGDTTLGSGGLGGGALLIFARRLEGNGTITTAGNPGKAGAPGYTSTTGDRPYYGGNGGGGGGAGGGILIVTQRGRRGALNVTAPGGTGGAGGAAGPSNGSTSGNTGSTGAAGTVAEYMLAS